MSPALVMEGLGTSTRSFTHKISANLPELRICNPALSLAGYWIRGRALAADNARTFAAHKIGLFRKHTPCPPHPLSFLWGASHDILGENR
jgi:hypothetical protein